MRSTLAQSTLIAFAIGLACWSAMNAAKADTIITETGTITGNTTGTGANLNGDPFTLTTDFDPTSATPLAGCTTTVCDQLSGSSVFTAPGYSLQIFPNPPSAVTLMWGSSTPSGAPTLQINDQFAGGATINGVPQEANGFSITSSVVGSTSIPNPLSLNGTFSTPASSSSLTISESASLKGLVSNITINAAPSPSLYLTVGTGGSSKSGSPIGIVGSLTLATQPPPPSLGTTTVLSVPLLVSVPSNDITLQQVANDLGYQGFDWQQTLSGPSPLPYYACTNPLCTATAEAVGSSDDPAQPYGWDYCNPGNPNFVPNSVYGNSCVSPYYYAPSIATDSTLSSDQATGCIYKYNGECITLTDAADTTFGFFDSPSDPCLTTNGVTPAYNKTLSNGETVAQLCQNSTASGALTFDTELVGIPKNGGLPVPIAGFDWLDTFNGLGFTNTPGMGGIIVPETDLTVDPQTGAGGITVTSVNGEAVSTTVPEPSSIVVILSSFVLLGVFHLFFVKNGRGR